MSASVPKAPSTLSQLSPGDGRDENDLEPLLRPSKAAIVLDMYGCAIQRPRLVRRMVRRLTVSRSVHPRRLRPQTLSSFRNEFGHPAAFLRRGQWSSAVLVRVSCRPWP